MISAKIAGFSLNLPARVDGDAGVERGRLQLGVAEQNMDHADVDILLEQVSGEAVPQGVRRDSLGDPATCAAA
jgi:hypothetical protein